MGQDKIKKIACAFYFVEYYSREDAKKKKVMWYLNELDEQTIHTDWNAGFKKSWQYSHGWSLGQVQDEYLQNYDGGRGGYRKLAPN